MNLFGGEWILNLVTIVVRKSLSSSDRVRHFDGVCKSCYVCGCM